MGDEELPVDGDVFRSLGIESRDLNEILGSVIFARIYEGYGKSGLSKSNCEGAATWS